MCLTLQCSHLAHTPFHLIPALWVIGLTAWMIPSIYCNIKKFHYLKDGTVKSSICKDRYKMKQVILGTAGHIDHGKTSLIKALTGIDADRLKEEKERGITIELGFAHLELPSGQLLVHQERDRGGLANDVIIEQFDVLAEDLQAISIVALIYGL